VAPFHLSGKKIGLNWSKLVCVALQVFGQIQYIQSSSAKVFACLYQLSFTLGMQRERIVPINIEDEMRDSYIDYSMSVIVSRALRMCEMV
jgi:hypothetical protein